TTTPTPTPTPTTTPTPTPTPTTTPTPTPTPTTTPTPTPTPTPNGTEVINWAGYIVASDLQNPQPTVTSVSASWVVPTVAPSTNDMFSAMWIGIGGQFDRTLIQVGTVQDSVGGQVAYSAWYEVLPRGSITISNITVSPGDRMQASIQLVNATFNQWTINMTDTTAEQSFQYTVNYASSQLSAEWIVERPAVNEVISQLANFGNVTFTNCVASVGSVTGGISSFQWNEMVMYSSTAPGSSSVQLTDVSDLTPDGTGFTVTYLSSR
ncbi:MAG: G1 family glutamic endopeptidase, partial [Candidatus Bathyarchaeia archaeon]